jgi:pyrimidine-nucleoside phosphorylase
MSELRDILTTKRDGAALDDSQIRAFIDGYVAGDVPDYVASALLMAIFAHGMEDAELVAWTGAMLRSGDVFSFPELDRPLVDKHSTGGVGDKVSIPLAPAVAACGAAVPMVSGRGLGHTGGTLDKLEAIPGFRTDLSRADFARCLAATGVALGGQTEELVPADRKLYALRDVTGLIESVPLIASSILSKKLAEGISGLVLDVKFGSGAFLTDRRRGAELARTMLRVASEMGLRAVAYQTCMDRPLGRTVGHAIEVRESVECLRGGGPPDLRALVCTLGGEMLALAGIAGGPGRGSDLVRAALDDGRAFDVFLRVVEAQGGDPRAIEDPDRLPSAPDVDLFRAERSGALHYADVRGLGRTVAALGGGRVRLGDQIDHSVGLRVLHRAGDEVAEDEALYELHHRGGRGLEEARRHLAAAVSIGPPSELPPLVLARLEG